MLDYRNIKLDKKGNIILTVVSAILSISIGWLFYDTAWGIGFTPLIFFILRPEVEKVIRGKRIRKLRNEFRDSLYSFSSSFAAGAHMEEAMEIAAHQIADIYGDDSDMARELTSMMKKMREIAGSDVELWNDLAYRSGIEDIGDFAGVFEATRDAGGNLVKAVDRAASLIVDKINIENEMRMLFSQKKTEGRMVGLVPVAMIMFLRISSPSYLTVMYETVLGKILMTGALATMGYAIYLTEKITRVKV